MKESGQSKPRKKELTKIGDFTPVFETFKLQYNTYNKDGMTEAYHYALRQYAIEDIVEGMEALLAQSPEKFPTAGQIINQCEGIIARRQRKAERELRSKEAPTLSEARADTPYGKFCIDMIKRFMAGEMTAGAYMLAHKEAMKEFNVPDDGQGWFWYEENSDFRYSKSKI